jgi:hypothetical protein
MSKALSFEHLTAILASVLESLPDHRTGKNSRYSLSDAGLAAFSVFFMQSPSFLAHQRDMEKRKGNSNAHSLFSIEKIPTDTHIRNLLDPITSESLFAPFRQAFSELEQAEVLKRFKAPPNHSVVSGANGKVKKSGHLLLVFDGTEHFSSEKLGCKSCTKRRLKNKTRYSHSVVTPIVVSPEQSEVISLEPAFILPQDGEEKQDCEIKAAKRWLNEQAEHYNLEEAIVLGDDLYAHQPWCEAVLEKRLNFVLVCKPESHKTLYEYLALYPPEELQQRRWNGRFTELYHYRFANGLPLRDGGDALIVNWCELSIYREDTKELLFRNSFITNFTITSKNVADIATWGRARWKVENENNNVLKTKGYHFEHNYGHGQENLSSVLITLLLYAFLCHTIFALTLPAYGQVRRALGRRDTFFNDIRALTRYHLFASFNQLLDFMMAGLELTSDTS